MDLDLFLHQLHFQNDLVTPPNWEVNWDDAPLPYKVYRHLPEYGLPYDIPLTIQDQTPCPTPDLNKIGHFLWYVYGLSQFNQTAFPSSSDEESAETMQGFRRFPPSGGGLYPSELYFYLKLEELPTGIYHYDVAHHRLLMLRKGRLDSYLTSALGNSSSLSNCFGAVIITTMFWKNFFKYHNFSYRLQGLDAGTLMGQLLEVSKRFSYSPTVHFQFLDQAVNHLLGLDGQEESTYAVIPLSEQKIAHDETLSKSTATDLSNTIAKIQTTHQQRSQTVLPFPEITKIHQETLLESTELFRQLETTEEKIDSKIKIALPEAMELPKDFAQACQSRYSPEMDFNSGRIDQVELASLLKESTNSYLYANDLDQEENQKPRVSIYGCFYQIEGIPNGTYRYDAASHSLLLIKEGDFRLSLQAGMSLHNVNLHQVPVCLHIVGDRKHYKNELGYRGYRIQHMEAGMLLQRILLTASALGMNGHPLLGFDINGCDEIYELEDAQKTTIIQVPIGFHRAKSWLVGGMHH
ncbi:SagB/ThcOx family dehydrogenase [Bacillus sp. es.036]|uniref:SagB/ThcOx family dehydrogenase n=1 Tax=Bacillus sp. es.036 TaxID=1761764 RepID=UPI000BF65C52|nr:SagB family peptide dehydrogenase [Bacillus sp. es.036]PFG12321.1 SagB-type dehydrogenase family enzyme [Bacillus sp. es.036]